MNQPSSRLSGENRALFLVLIFFHWQFITLHWIPIESTLPLRTIVSSETYTMLCTVSVCFWTVMLGTVSKEAGQHSGWERSVVKNERSYRRRKRVKWREFTVRFTWSIMLIARIIIRVGSARCKCTAPQIQIVPDLRNRYLNSFYAKWNTSILLPTE